MGDQTQAYDIFQTPLSSGYPLPLSPEMEFLDINSTIDSSLLLHAINSSSYWQIRKKTILFFGFKNLNNEKTAQQENAGLFMKSIL